MIVGRADFERVGKLRTQHHAALRHPLKASSTLTTALSKVSLLFQPRDEKIKPSKTIIIFYLWHSFDRLKNQ